MGACDERVRLADEPRPRPNWHAHRADPRLHLPTRFAVQHCVDVVLHPSLAGLGLQRGFALCVLFILWPVGAGLELGLASSPREVWQCLIGTYVLLISCMALLSGCSSWQRLSEVAIANSKVTGDTSDARASQVAAQSVTSSGGAASGLAAADSAAIQVSAL